MAKQGQKRTEQNACDSDRRFTASRLEPLIFCARTALSLYTAQIRSFIRPKWQQKWQQIEAQLHKAGLSSLLDLVCAEFKVLYADDTINTKTHFCAAKYKVMRRKWSKKEPNINNNENYRKGDAKHLGFLVSIFG